LLRGMVVAGQLDWQEVPNRLRVLQEVQLVCVTEHVAQSPWHGCAKPLIFTYPLGVVPRHCALK